MKDKKLQLERTYLTLDNKMHSIIDTYDNKNSDIALFNKDLSKELGLDFDYLNSKEGINVLSGSSNINGTLYAQAYGGHQYGHFSMLGDGRAVLLGEYVTPNNHRFDLQLKGSGRTPYSRRGDGKAALYSMLREYLISEAMNGLLIPTTRSLAVLKTNEEVTRMKQEPGGILVRVASSHIRVGTFEYARVYGGKELVKELADYTIKRHFPSIENNDDKYQKLLFEVVKRQAELISTWQSVGFIHGVMNTDNMLISGETIDYGPCAFMNTYNPKTVFSSIDQEGRYAYQNQPYIGSWNLSRFAESILELLDEDNVKAVDKANGELKKYADIYKKTWLNKMGRKLGIKNATEEDKVVVDELLLIMDKYNADFTNTFASLSRNRFEDIVFYETAEWVEWFKKWTRSLGYRQTNLEERMDIMKSSNPVIIPRNSIVEKALIDASSSDDYNLFNELLNLVKDPYNYTVKLTEKFTQSADEPDYKTYCGT
jgi:uncharacterized protein YdiU (UPF0061 family)